MDTSRFSSEYHRARRNLTLSGATLLAWEFIGFELQNNASLPLVGISLNIRNPQVVPSMLTCLVLFFSVRLLIEWKQSDINQRTYIYSRVDFALAFFIAIIGISVFIFQSTTQTDIALIFAGEGNPFSSAIFTALFTSFCGAAIGEILADRHSMNTYYTPLLIASLFFILLITAPIIQLRTHYLKETLSPLLTLTILIPVILGFVAMYLSYQIRKNK